MVSTPAVWKQYNKMAVLHFFLVNSSQIYILFSKGFTNHTAAYRCIFLSNQSINLYLSWGHCIYVVHITVCTKNLHSAEVPGEGAWVELSLSYYGKQFFAFFKPIVHFYKNVVSMSTFKRCNVE